MGTYDDGHKRQYEAALRSADVTDAPAWEDLTDEQRENIRAVNNQHQNFMDKLGVAISTGGELPYPAIGENE